MPLLLWLFFAPFIASALVFIVPRLPKPFFVLLSLIPLGLLLYGHNTLIGSEVNYEWFKALSIHFHLRIDPISLLFLYLTAIVIPFSVVAAKHPSNLFYGLVFLLQALLIGFFCAQDLALFTIFWEAILIPLYFMINLWGGSEKHRAAMQFLLYMIAGSALMVAAVLALYITTGTFNFDALATASDRGTYSTWVAAIFLLAFAVKTPLFPFHGWLPDAYTEASTSGSILLAALLSKAGIYGFIRIGLGLFPSEMQAASPLLLSLAITGVFWGAFAAWQQNDFKRLLAYSSFSHVNFILVGLFVWSEKGLVGSLLQAFNHGITITALFLVAGWLTARLGSTSMNRTSGLAKFLPHLCWITLFFVLASVALPGMNNFVGELLILSGLFQKGFWITAFLGLIIIFSVVYMLRWMQKVYFGPFNPFQASFVDIKTKEIAIAIPLMVLVLWIGLYPMPILTEITPAAQTLLRGSP